MSAADDARAALVDGLCASGRIRSAAVEEAFRSVPRHLFLPGSTPAAAYADGTVAVQRVDGVATSSASQPSMVAIMLEQLDLRPGQRVLEIGAGTGWNAALMARIVGPTGRVTTVDIDPDLVEGAARHLAGAGVDGVEVVCADGALGHPPGAPYDRIVLTVGSGDVWPAWPAQLAPGGRLLLPLALRGSQLSTALDLAPDGELHSHSLRSCGFIRLRGVGATTDVAAVLPGGLTLHGVEDEPGFDAAALGAALGEPGEARPSPVALGPADVWDGFGLWLALTEPGVGRLVAAGPDTGLPDPLGYSAAVVLATPSGAPRAGLAMVVVACSGTVTVRPFGEAGAERADTMLAALDRWVAAGAPAGSDWRITVRPASTSTATAGASIVRTQHCDLIVDLPTRPAAAAGG